MKQPYLVLAPGEIREYIQTQVDVFSPGAEIPNKMLEFATALVLARFHLKQTGEHSNFLFPLRSSAAGIKGLAEVIQKYIDEDTPIDIHLISSGITLDKSPLGKTKAIAFQLKRFNLGSSNRTEELKEFLTEDIPRHYAPVKATLVILIEGVGSIDIRDLHEALRTLKEYPFPNVLYVVGEGEANVTIGEMWPQNGRSTFTKEEWFADPLKGESVD